MPLTEGDSLPVQQCREGVLQMGGSATAFLMLLVAITVARVKGRRRRAELDGEMQVEEPRSKTTPAARPEPLPEGEIRWPVCIAKDTIKRFPETLRMVEVAHGARRRQLVRCVQVALGGELATEVVEVSPDGEDLGEPEYLRGYSISQAVSEFVG